jgi:heme exporter protein C
MWKFLYQLASPKSFYQLTGRFIPWLSVCAMLLLSSGLIWGLCFAPADYQQGDAFRIIYVHVPAAFLSMALFAQMGFLAILLLVWRIKLAGLMLSMCAQLGAAMAFLALVTGSIWGKPMWGTWWIWDARLTSELVLFLLYLAIIGVGYAFQNKDQSDKVVAILTVVGLVDLPIIHYSVYWWNTLHQGSTISVFSKSKIDPSMLYPLLLTLTGFLMYAALAVLLKARNELLLREKRQSWVKQLIERGDV